MVLVAVGLAWNAGSSVTFYSWRQVGHLADPHKVGELGSTPKRSNPWRDEMEKFGHLARDVRHLEIARSNRALVLTPSGEYKTERRNLID